LKIGHNFSILILEGTDIMPNFQTFTSELMKNWSTLSPPQ